MRKRIRTASFLAAGLLISSCAGDVRIAAAFARPPITASGARIPVDEARMVTLEGNVHPLARAEFDRGEVNPGTRLDRMMLLLKPSAAQQAALDELVEEQQNPHSPFYRQWLTPSEFGARFGADDSELKQVTAWLAGQGFTVDEIPAGRRLLIFSGTARCSTRFTRSSTAIK